MAAKRRKKGSILDDENRLGEHETDLWQSLDDLDQPFCVEDILPVDHHTPDDEDIYQNW